MNLQETIRRIKSIGWIVGYLETDRANCTIRAQHCSQGSGDLLAPTSATYETDRTNWPSELKLQIWSGALNIQPVGLWGWKGAT